MFSNVTAGNVLRTMYMSSVMKSKRNEIMFPISPAGNVENCID